MLNLSNGLYVTGQLSNEEYANYIKDDLSKVTTLLQIGITRSRNDHERDTIMRISYQRLVDLHIRIGNRIEKGGFA